MTSRPRSSSGQTGPNLFGGVLHKGRWERMAEQRLRELRRAELDELDAGHGDALRAAGKALDLAEEQGSAGTMEYARRGWSEAMRALRTPPAERSGVGADPFADLEAELRRAEMGHPQDP